MSGTRLLCRQCCQQARCLRPLSALLMQLDYAPPAPPLFQAPMMDWMTINGMASASVHEAPLKATAKCSLGRSGSLTRTSEPVK